MGVQDQISIEQRQAIQKLSRSQLQQLQLEKLNRLLAELQQHSGFYQPHLKNISLPLDSIEELTQLPFTFKEHLIRDDGGTNYSANLTYPIQRYSRFHRTSGTSGRPLVVLDTESDWQWWSDCWQFVLDVAGVRDSDRVLLAFSFGPFIGFWSAFDAAIARGALCIPSGGMSSLARLEMLQATSANVLFCTPSYALHLAETAAEHQISVGDLAVERLVVAGEPGGSIPEIRQQIESVWRAKVIDHSGASEVGAWGFADPEGQGLYINESEFIAEFRSIETGGPAEPGELSELILTNLGRFGGPVIRYRTGDLVRPGTNDGGGSNFAFLPGGVLGRADDMMIVRGVNVFPSSIERILRSFPEIVEFRMTVFKEQRMDQLLIEIEDKLNDPQRVIREMQIRLGLRVDIRCVPPGSLPRFDLKGKRFVDNR